MSSDGADAARNMLGSKRALARVDFTGDVGHEIGLLEIAVNQSGLMHRIDASLE